jgi:hypothetical protein
LLYSFTRGCLVTMYICQLDQREEPSPLEAHACLALALALPLFLGFFDFGASVPCSCVFCCDAAGGALLGTSVAVG